MNILLLFGGQSYEHDVSAHSATFILHTLTEANHVVYPVAVTIDGTWILTDTNKQIAHAHSKGKLYTTIEHTAHEHTDVTVWTVPSNGIWYDLQSPKKLPVDIVFPVIHGHNGEDGTLQGLLDIAHIPYTGCGITASVLCMNKHIAKKIWQANDIPVLPQYILYRHDYLTDKKQAVSSCMKCIDIPAIIKPTDGGSSVGVFTAHNEAALIKAIEKCMEITHTIIIEPYISPVREIETAITGNTETLTSYPSGEVIVTNGKVYDYNLKYHSTENDVYLKIPADISAKEMNTVRTLAERAYQVLGCEGYARIDCFLTPEGEVFLNEINTVPGFTKISMFPKMVCAQNQNAQTLLTTLLDHAKHSFYQRQITIPKYTDSQ